MIGKGERVSLRAAPDVFDVIEDINGHPFKFWPTDDDYALGYGRSMGRGHPCGCRVPPCPHEPEDWLGGLIERCRPPMPREPGDALRVLWAHMLGFPSKARDRKFAARSLRSTRSRHSLNEKRCAIDRHAAGESYGAIAADLGVSRATVQAWCRRGVQLYAVAHRELDAQKQPGRARGRGRGRKETLKGMSATIPMAEKVLNTSVSGFERPEELGGPNSEPRSCLWRREPLQAERPQANFPPLRVVAPKARQVRT